MTYLPIILGLLPAFAWLVFYLEEDPHPEPKRLIFQTFLAGGISTFIVYGTQTVFSDWATTRGIAEYTLFSFIGLAAIEEFFKFGAAWLVINKNREYFDEPVDAMIYLIVASLGFAAVENIAAATNAGELALKTTTLRFIGATLLHTLSSGLLGYYWAMSIIKKKIGLFFGGLVLATMLHTAFNYLILSYEEVIIPTTFLIIFGVFVLYDFDKLKN